MERLPQMANEVHQRAPKAFRRPEGTLPDLGDVPERAKAAAEELLGPAVIESLRPAFEDDEEDTSVTRVVLQKTRDEIEQLCREFIDG